MTFADGVVLVLSRLSGAPLAAAALIFVAAVALSIVLRAVAVVAREIPAIISARETRGRHGTYLRTTAHSQRRRRRMRASKGLTVSGD